MALLVSGGHSELNLMTDHLTYQRLGSTLDDAAGEAFDKVARLLELGYPGGPSIQKAAEDGDASRFHFPRAWLEGTHDFSFSGLKTAVLYEVRELKKRSLLLGIIGMRWDTPHNWILTFCRPGLCRKLGDRRTVTLPLKLRSGLACPSQSALHIGRMYLLLYSAR